MSKCQFVTDDPRIRPHECSRGRTCVKREHEAYLAEMRGETDDWLTSRSASFRARFLP